MTSLTSPQSHGASEPPQRGDFSASANVAALLGIKPQVTVYILGQLAVSYSLSFVTPAISLKITWIYNLKSRD